MNELNRRFGYGEYETHKRTLILRNHVEIASRLRMMHMLNQPRDFSRAIAGLEWPWRSSTSGRNKYARPHQGKREMERRRWQRVHAECA